MKSITKITTVILISLAAITTFSFLGANHAEALFTGATDQACSGVTLSDQPTSCGNSTSSINSLVSDVIYILSWIVGIAAIIMVIFGGFRFVISGGDAQATTSARNTIFYALIGLALAVLAQVLVHFVFKKANQAPKTAYTVIFSLAHLPSFLL